MRRRAAAAKMTRDAYTHTHTHPPRGSGHTHPPRGSGHTHSPKGQRTCSVTDSSRCSSRRCWRSRSTGAHSAEAMSDWSVEETNASCSEPGATTQRHRDTETQRHTDTGTTKQIHPEASTRRRVSGGVEEAVECKERQGRGEGGRTTSRSSFCAVSSASVT